MLAPECGTRLLVLLAICASTGAGYAQPASLPPTIFFAAAPNSDAPAISAGALKLLYLDQGWDAATREQFYSLTQGSQLIPYDWFVNLEQADSVEPFCSDANMRRMGFITRPDALPVGFALDDSPDTAMDSYQIRKESLGPDYKIENFPTTNKWLGLTCAACHTSEIEYGNTLFRIDGGATLADLEGFERGLLGALKATSSDDAKFQRFARLVRGTLDGPNGNPVENEALRARLEAYTGALESEIGHNILPGQEPYGYGRLDAFGAILNKVCGASLEEPENYRPANAPVSYPFLWDTPKLDWVQWNGSVANAMARNVGEVVGVFAHLNLTAEDERYRFRSTANTNNLDTLESWLAELKAPEWNQDILGRFDEDKVRLGKGLFARNCAHCHGVRDANGEFPMTEANPFGGRFIKTHMITAFPPEKDKLGTDPLMISNFVTRLVKPGALGEYLPEELRGAPVAPGAVVLSTAVEKVIRKKLLDIKNKTPKELEAIALQWSGYHTPGVDAPNPLGYKARPLNGIWATAPYLHNGSVPNLYQLLLPARERVKDFYVGSRDFDTVNVGFKYAPGDNPGGFHFNTIDDGGKPIPGNANTGHEGKGYTGMRDENGYDRDFTEDERWALVEYMKTLK